jgi:AbrB family looped-hinge helix DNA binding protein
MVYTMSGTTTIDEAGRIVVPKAIREQMRLKAGTKLKVSLEADMLKICEEPIEPRISRRKDGMRVITGWAGYDAAQAVTEAREQQISRDTISGAE